MPSLIRVTRLCVVESGRLLGTIGTVSEELLNTTHTRIGNWILGVSQTSEEDANVKQSQPTAEEAEIPETSS